MEPSSESTIDRDFFLMTGKKEEEGFKPVYEGYFSKIHWKRDPSMNIKGKNFVKYFFSFLISFDQQWFLAEPD